MDKKILAFPKRVFMACTSCGTPFSPDKPRHRLCVDCFYWNNAINGIIATRQALREVRS